MLESLRAAAALAHDNRGFTYLLGIEPDMVDTELGYVLPASRSRNRPCGVLRFVEKPTAMRAKSLVDQGALWNAFIMAGSVQALLRLFGSSFTSTIAVMRGFEGVSIENVYERLGSVDFSRDVLQGNESVLQVLAVPHCGWTDLGTPQRIGMTLERLLDQEISLPHRPYIAPHLNLAQQYDRLLQIALGFRKRVLAVHHRRSGLFPELFHLGSGNIHGRCTHV